jgi:mono/diheme cytochrome c family protein
MNGGRVLLLFFFLAAAPLAWCEDSATGRELYRENCAPCHGAEGRGDGAGIGALPVKPANHTDPVAMSAYSDEYLFNVIAEGGVAVGRSPFMPAWGEQLTAPQITSLVAYIRTLSEKPKQ